jgi:two-component system chemotaxis sensor kinase CheA
MSDQQGIIKYLILPKEITATELRHVEQINSIAIGACLAHIPLFVLVAWLCGTSIWQALGFGALLIAGPAFASKTLHNPRHLSLVYGFTTMGLGALLVHLGQGSMQIEMHFHFFASLALLTVWGNPLIIWVATVTAALHHGLFYFFLPKSVFNYEASIWVVLVHALFVVVEAIAASFIARNFYDNVIGLEKIVDQKTAEVKEKSRAIKTIMDHVTIGLVICDQKLRIQPGYSAACKTVLNIDSDIDGQELTKLLQLNPRTADHFKAIYDQIFDSDLLIGDLSVDYLPTRFEIGAKSVGITGSVVHNEAGKSVGVLFCIADVTNLAKAEEEIECNRGLIKMITNRDAFRQFVLDTHHSFNLIKQEIAKSSKSGSQEIVRRELHTLKGNSATYGLTHLSKHIHELEENHAIDISSVEIIELEFVKFLNDHNTLLGVTYGESYEEAFTVPATLVNQTELQLQNLSHPDQFIDLFSDFVRSIRLKQVKTVLGPIQENFAQLTARLGKSAKLSIKGETVLVPTELKDLFRVIVHIIRNSVDHGIESPLERSHKSEEGQVTLEVTRDADVMTIKIADDGRGLQKAQILKKSIEKGLITEAAAKSMSDQDIYKLIFAAGLSTAETVTEISGRGVGLDAVLTVIHELGGNITVNSIPGQGTTFVIKAPIKKANITQKGAKKAA